MGIYRQVPIVVGFGFSLFPISSGFSAHFHYWIDRKTTWHPALTNKRKGPPKLIRQSHEISLPIWARDFGDIHLLRLLCARAFATTDTASLVVGLRLDALPSIAYKESRTVVHPGSRWAVVHLLLHRALSHRSMASVRRDFSPRSQLLPSA